MTSKQFETFIVEMIAKAYNEVMGADAFESRTAKDQHDIIMKLVEDMTR